MDMNEKKPGNPWTKSLLIWMAVLLGLVIFVQSIGGSRATTGQAVAYSDFVNQVEEGNVQSVTIATSPGGNATLSGKLNSGQTFRTTAPGDANVSDRLIAKGVAVQVKAEEQSSIWLYMVANKSADVGIAALDLNSGESIAVKGDTPFPMASTVKVAVAALYLAQVDHAFAIVAAALAFTASADSSRSRNLTLLAALAIAVSGIIGVYHAGVEAKIFEGFTTCTKLVTGGSTADMLKQISQAPLVRCDQVQFSFLGISMAGWNAILSLGGAATILFLTLRGVRR